MTQPSGDAEVVGTGESGVEAEVDDVGTGVGLGAGAGAGGGVETERSADRVLADVAAFTRLPPGAFAASDSGNARRFTHLYGNIVRYAADSKMWYVWAGSRWRADVGDLTVLGLTLGVANYVRNVESMIMSDDVERLGRHALASESEGSRRHMLRLAAAEPGIKILESDLDADPRLLVVSNGTLDLRTGKLRPSRTVDLCTRRAATAYDPDADCPLWKSHIKFVTKGDPVLAAYLRRACGYSLTGLVNEQKFWFLWGDGDNGKNVFMETIAGLLGEYGSVAPPGLLTGGTSQHPTILADLRGARVVVVDETGDERVNDARVKMLTGSARVKARFMGKDFFEYDSTMKLWVLGNTKPTIKDQSDGTWRRMQLVPFAAKIPDKVKRSGFVDELRAEWSGILNWCLAGLDDWQRSEGLGTPDVVSQAVETYRAEEDEIGQWLLECCERCDSSKFTPVSTLYTSYTSWCQVNGIKPKDIMSVVPWGRAITGRTVGTYKITESYRERIGKKQVRVRAGIRLIEGQFGLTNPAESVQGN